MIKKIATEPDEVAALRQAQDDFTIKKPFYKCVMVSLSNHNND
jgi:hypothetical protein